MARQIKKSLSYFNLDCDIFSKTSELRPLLRRYKADGLAVFIHILCDVYGNGYYFKIDDYEDYCYDIAEDCGITVEKVKLIIAFMQDRTLLTAFSLDKNTVITSHGIQKHYAEAMKLRKRSVAEIKGDYWLLTEKEEAEIDTFFKTRPNENKSENNTDKSENNTDKSENNATKERKGNKSKENNINTSKEVIIESKKESKYRDNNLSSSYARESYEDILSNNVGYAPLRRCLWEFIQHCQLNGKMVTNDKLYDVIVGLDTKYGKDESAKCNAVKEAIRKGYFDIKRE